MEARTQPGIFFSFLAAAPILAVGMADNIPCRRFSRWYVVPSCVAQKELLCHCAMGTGPRHRADASTRLHAQDLQRWAASARF